MQHASASDLALATDHEVPSARCGNPGLSLGETSAWAYPAHPDSPSAWPWSASTSGQGETGGAYPRTPQPSMVMEALTGHLSSVRSEPNASEPPAGTESSETSGPHGSAAGSSGSPRARGAAAAEGSETREPGQPAPAAPEVPPLKRYTSDIGGGDGLADFAARMHQDRQQLLKRYTSDIGGAERLAGSATSMQQGRQQAADSPDAAGKTSEGPLHGSEGQSRGAPAGSREMRRVTSDIGGGEGLADLARSLQPVPEAQPLVPQSGSPVSY